MSFSDYEQVVNNFSLPVSCCDTTNPLANETTCPDIVMDTNVTTELIYTEGCVPQLVSYFHYIHSVVAGVSIITGAIPVYCIVTLYVFLFLINCVQIIGTWYISSMIGRNYSTRYINFLLILTTFGFNLVFSFGFIIVAVQALIQDVLFYYPITAPANTNVIIISVLLIIAGGLMIGASTFLIISIKRIFDDCGCCILFSTGCVTGFLVIIFSLVVGSVAAGMSGPTSIELKSTLHKYLDNQPVQETWNELQKNMECCGVDHFTDYETVFSNFSVPVSCCNTTNPLASECPDIVRNSQKMINQTGLIYSEGCVSHLESFFNNIFTVIAAVTIIIAGLQLLAVLIWSWYLIESIVDLPSIRPR